MKNSNWTLKESWNRVGEIWCRLAHPEPMWPIHGYYQCPKCHRRHPVRWESSAPMDQASLPVARRFQPGLSSNRYEPGAGARAVA